MVRVGRRRLARALSRLGLYAGLAAVLLPFMFVFFWMATSSLKVPVEIFAIPPVWIFQPTLQNYRTAFEAQPFGRYFLNSAIVAVASTLLGMTLGLPAAYSIARYRQQKLALAILAARIMPGVAYLVPLFLLFRNLGLLGTHPALIASHVLVTFPLTVWVMITFFEDLPSEILDAAFIDGCSRFGAFWRVALPMTRPGLVATAILAFIFSWNDFKFALILSSAETRTLPVAVFHWVGFISVDWGPLMASATVITLPALILVLFIQRHIVSGLTLGGVKG